MRLYTVFDRIFDFDWRVMEGGGGVSGPPQRLNTALVTRTILMMSLLPFWALNVGVFVFR